MLISGVSYMRVYCLLKGAVLMFYKKTRYYSETETYDMFCVAYVLGIIRKNVSLLTELIIFIVLYRLQFHTCTNGAN